MKLIEGFNKDINNEEYHKDREYISSSGLKLLLKDPREFVRVYVNNEPSSTGNRSALDLGSYIHMLVLEPHLEYEEFAVYEGAMRRGENWEVFSKENEDKIIIMKSQEELAKSLMQEYNEAAVYIKGKELKVATLFTQGEAEETLCGTIDGVKIKTRFDYRQDGVRISDVKTTSKIIENKGDAEQVCKDFGYDVSAALYVDMAKKYTGKDHEFLFVFFSKDSRSVKKITVFKASEQMLEKGRQKYKEAIKLLKAGRKTGNYFIKDLEEVDSI